MASPACNTGALRPLSAVASPFIVVFCGKTFRAFLHKAGRSVKVLWQARFVPPVPVAPGVRNRLFQQHAEGCCGRWWCPSTAGRAAAAPSSCCPQPLAAKHGGEKPPWEASACPVSIALSKRGSEVFPSACPGLARHKPAGSQGSGTPSLSLSAA